MRRSSSLDISRKFDEKEGITFSRKKNASKNLFMCCFKPNDSEYFDVRQYENKKLRYPESFIVTKKSRGGASEKLTRRRSSLKSTKHDNYEVVDASNEKSSTLTVCF